MAGKKGASVSVKILDLEDFDVQYGPEEFTRKRELITQYKTKFSSNDVGSDHLLLIEGNSSSLKNKSLATIKLNGKIIFTPLDMIFDKNHRIMKLISVKEENTLDVILLGSVGSKIKISVLSLSDSDSSSSFPPGEPTSKASPGDLVLANHKIDQFNQAGLGVIFNVVGAELNTENATISHNGNILEPSQFLLSDSQIRIPNILVEGRNDFFIYAFDKDGGMLYWEEGSIWAGSAIMAVGVYNQKNPVSGAVVTCHLGDDDRVEKTVTTNANGVAYIYNVPERTVSCVAKYQGLVGTHINHIRDGQFERIDLIQMIPSSNIDNNDFSKGLEGWETYDSDVRIVPHREYDFDWNTVPSVNLQPMGMTQAMSQAASTKIENLTFEQKKQLRKSQGRMIPALTSSAKSGFVTMAIGEVNNDLQLSTGGKVGPSKAERSFKTTPGVANVKARYRFITSEVPGGFFGSEFNDGYSLTIMSSTEGKSASNKSNMNNMGLGAFSSSGASSWRELNLAVNPDGDTVQVTATVANVGDDAFDSIIEIDLIEETPFRITKASLFDIDGYPLEALSLSKNNEYFGGNTRIHGSIEFTGVEGDSISSLELQVLQGGAILATGDVNPVHNAILNSPFTSSEVKTISKSLLFNIPNSKIGNVNQVETTYVTFKIVARTKDGKSHEFSIEPKGIKVLPNLHLTKMFVERFTGRDNVEGGDDWGSPECLATAKKLMSKFVSKSFIVGDISNMNGGRFSPHGSHRVGTDVDFAFKDFHKINADTAKTLLEIAKSDDNIILMGVTYKAQDGDPFYDAIKNESIRGKKATSVIQVWGEHDDHFHFRCAR